MISKKIKAGGIFLAGASLLVTGLAINPNKVSADSSLCTRTNNYYFIDTEVDKWFADSDYAGHYYRVCDGISTDSYCNGKEKGTIVDIGATSGVGMFSDGRLTTPKNYAWRTNFDYDSNINSTNINEKKTIVDITRDDVEKWMDYVYKSVTENQYTFEVTSGDKSEYDYMHYEWVLKTDAGKEQTMSEVHGIGVENPVYSAGVIRGVYDYIDDNPGDDYLLDMLIDETYESLFRANSISITYNDDVADNKPFTITREYEDDNVSGVNSFNMAKWAMFQHYNSGTGKFEDPLGGCDDMLSGCTYTLDLKNSYDNSTFVYGGTVSGESSVETTLKWTLPSESDNNAATNYILWYNSGYMQGLSDMYKAAADTDEVKEIGSREWTPGASSWYSNFVIKPVTYTYDCSSGTVTEEPEETSPSTGIPSYGYLAIILAGAASVYVIAKKRNKFVKF